MMWNARVKANCRRDSIRASSVIARLLYAVPPRASGVGRAGSPADDGRPLIGFADRRPEEVALGVGVGVAVVAEACGQVAFDRLVARRRINVGAQVVAKQERPLLVPTARAADVDVAAPRAADLPEVALGPFGI